MGCWFETCGISNLPIKDGQEVVVFVLTRNDSAYEKVFCYSNTLYSVLPIPFYAKYDDYGSAYDCSGVGLDIVMDTIKNKLVEKEVGDNSVHDIEIKRNEFNTELFFDACHENRLFIKKGHKEIKVDRVMMHKNIFDHILENNQYRKYIGYEKPYLYYTFADIVADVPKFVKRLKSKWDNTNFLFHDYIFERLFDEDEINLANDWLMNINVHGSRSPLFSISQEMTVILNTKTDEEVEEFFVEYLKGVIINDFFSSTRKLWTPQCGRGSQNQDPARYRLLINAMNNVLDKELFDLDDD